MAATTAATLVNPTHSTSPISISATDPVATVTASFLDWQPAPAVGGVNQVSLKHSEMMLAFAIRCKLARTPADTTALAPVNPLTLRMNAAAWGRILTRMNADGLAAATVDSLPKLHDFIRGLPAHADYTISAPDWQLFPTWAAGTNAAQRLSLGRVRFLHLANAGTLEIASGPLATSAPWTAICKLIGAIGDVGTQATRMIEASCVQSTAETIRTQSVGGQTGGALAHNLRSNLMRAMLPKVLLSPGATAEEQSEELNDAFAYKKSDADRKSVEQKRVDNIAPW